jgi:hypothetical protein
MSKSCDHLPRFSASGLATGCILTLIVAMAISVFFDVQPAEASTTNKMAHTVSVHA